MLKLVAARRDSWEDTADRIGEAIEKLKSERDAAIAQRNAAIIERDAARGERDELASEVAMHRSFDAEHDAHCDLMADIYWKLDAMGFGG